MAVIFNNKKIIPAPFCSIGKQYARSGDGTPIGSVYAITLTGTLVAWKGSPSGAGLSSFWTLSGNPPDAQDVFNDNDKRLENLLRKQEAMRLLFALEGKTLEIEPLSGTAPIKCNPRVIGLDFTAGKWFDRTDYTITLEADVLFINGTVTDEDSFGQFLSNASEDWQLGVGDEEDVFNLTHSVSAAGKVHYDTNGNLVRPAWKEAREWVQSRLGLDLNRIDASGALNLTNPNYTGFNHVRAENVSEMGGTYEVTETWVITSGTALETYTVNTSQATATDKRTSVTIDGNIAGLDIRDSDFALTTTKYQSASGWFGTIQDELLTRAQTISGFSLNLRPLTKSIGRNTRAGVITYSYAYDNRPSGLVLGALQEVISISDNHHGQIVASIPIIGRAKGPILQDIGTVTERRRTLSINVTMPSSGNLTFNNPPDVSGVISLVTPTATQTFKTRDTANWNWQQGSYTRSIEWLFQN